MILCGFLAILVSISNLDAIIVSCFRRIIRLSILAGKIKNAYLQHFLKALAP
jgi:hypothetical protein